MNRLLKITLAVGALALTTLACKKTPDTPPISVLGDNSTITIDSLRKWQIAEGGPIVVEDSISLFGYVTMDESNGNVYKNIYLEDEGAAINVRFEFSTNLVNGDYIRIGLLGTTISDFNGVIQLSGVDEQKNVVVRTSDNDVTPLTITIPELEASYASYLAGDVNQYEYQSRLIKLENVQFKGSELNNTYADAVNQSSENRTFEDLDGNELFIRTSGFADFAADSLPKGNGSMICIVSEFNDELQLLLRSPEEANLTGARGPGELLVKDFDDDDLTSGGWTVQQVIGSETWEVGDLGSWEDRPYGVITNYDGSNSACESWFVSPMLDLSASATASLSFDNAYNYSGAPLEVLISSNYAGTGDPNGATWFALSAIWSSGGFEFINSGNIDLSTYLVSGVHIAFKYTGTDSDGRTWEIDNITING